MPPRPADPTTSSAATASGIAAVIVLAAGQGTRMRSRKPKVLHELAGKPLIWHALSCAAALRPTALVAVLGHGRDDVGGYLTGADDLPTITTAVQDEQKGTGHACACALEVTGPLSGTVIVTYGDVPLLQTATLQALADTHASSGNAVTVLTATVDNPTGYGRIIRDEGGNLLGIVEQKDADEAQRAIREINSGVYAFDGAVLTDGLSRLSDANAAGERYLTDVVGIAQGDGRRVGSLHAADPVETEGVNDRVQLAEMARVLNARLVRRAQLAGVTIHDPATTWIHADVTIGTDTEILPGTQLRAGTSIGQGCSIGPDTTLTTCTVADGASVVRSHAEQATIGAGASVGPFSYLRPGAVLQERTKAGAFVEIKKSTVGAGSKVPHLSYIGDTTIGAGVNIGAGTITANYDGDHKYPTVIGDQVFVGSDSTLVAPVTLGDGAYVAAGSTITGDLGPGALGVARGRQHVAAGWVLRKRVGTRAAAVAQAALADEPVQLPTRDEPTT
ncbi:bifunctional UDP-N-acetylglucosamine diphosphorylase/glucosamine-1-phosphate N-acetyltransferase GlmU [Nakamurella multipartita]|uniref:Bifunctional protein GlmU n=1 Tax=Nakamurella multipartita (strain ATCC 700099 / DSM 44233 / CIP 104796 / JCM 9543 / NBRC 105858 / Y-104) TaxID=479431 RepID=C8X6Q7_NAKMY|nr:bifunctional UDP-N-acetylglucosamine diphosphorylase/glucosamine-1-phosphate N-acetyltransferase GlmU [Nakamurella multipartita]ACV80805.1 UDP-N-acetylglucosamine pyrophosphorylase [Nakamurella multipartita DSM 44233]